MMKQVANHSVRPIIYMHIAEMSEHLAKDQ